MTTDNESNKRDILRYAELEFTGVRRKLTKIEDQEMVEIRTKLNLTPSQILLKAQKLLQE